jgi:HK97 family phage major capsid protein
MDRIELLEQLIEKETDEAKLKELRAELIAAIREDERQKAQAEADEKAADEERTEKAAQSPHGQIPVQPKIEVTEAEKYKGVNLKAAIGALQDNAKVPAGMRRLAKANREQAEEVAKYGIDLLQKSVVGDARKLKALTEGDATQGAELVPEERRSAILAYMRETSVALQYANVVPMTSDTLDMPKEDGSVSMTYTDEASEATETSAVFDEVTLTAKRLDGYVEVTNELLQDNDLPGGIAGLLTAQFLEAGAKKIDSTVFVGTGSPVSGVMLSAGDSVVFGTDSTAFSELLASDIRSAVAQIPANRDDNARWFMHKTVLYNLVYNLKGDNNEDIFVANHYDMAPGRIWGYPVSLVTQAPSAADSGADTGFIVFGDLSGFMIGERIGSMQLLQNPYAKMTKNITQFIVFQRWAFAHALNGYYTRIVTDDGV